MSARPPRDFSSLLDIEFAEIKSMVKPGARRRLDAKARLRALAILEASLRGEKSQPRDTDLDRIVRRINDGEEWRDIFPGVATLMIDPDADGPGISLRLTKSEGEAVRIVEEGTPGATVLAVRKINETSYYSMGFNELQKKLKLNRSKLLFLIDLLGLRTDPETYKVFRIGKSEHKRYSHKALDRLRQWLANNDLDNLWNERRAESKAGLRPSP